MFSTIDSLREIISENLFSEIDRDYVLLEVPNYRNIGDSLIWEGEEEFLRSISHECRYRCSLHFYDRSMVPDDCIILLTGGGNFGDIWDYSQNFRRMIIKNHPKNKIVIFPQTIFYHSISIARDDATLFSMHGDILICARDSRSYDFVKYTFTNVRLKLVPDMAFFINVAKYAGHFSKKIGKTLLMIRNDKELNVDSKILGRTEDLHTDIRDWPTYPRNIFFEKLLLGLELMNIKLSRFILRIPFIKNVINPIYGLNPFDMRNFYVKLGIRFFSKYDYIHTTRLHGHILAILLDIPHTFYDNSYGKNSQFYSTWTKEFEIVDFEKL